MCVRVFRVGGPGRPSVNYLTTITFDFFFVAAVDSLQASVVTWNTKAQKQMVIKSNDK